MKIIDVKNVQRVETPHKAEVRRLYDTPDAQAMHITLQPGEALRPHITPVDVFFYVLEGTGVVQIGAEKRAVGADHLVESPKGIVHCWFNESAEVFRVLVVKAPKPASKAQIL